LSIDGIGRHPVEIESTFYLCILAALQNAVQHARARGARIVIERRSDPSMPADRLRFISNRRPPRT